MLTRTADIYMQGRIPAPTVTVNGYTTERLGNAFFKALPVAGTVATVQDILVRAEKMVNGQLQVTEDTSQQFVPAESEIFAYDADGNMTSDGQWAYTWDGENRLIAMETLATVAHSEPKRLTFEYDGHGRRTHKTVYVWDSGVGAFTLGYSIRFAWDGWDLLREVHSADGTYKRYVWNPAHPRGHRTLFLIMDNDTNPQYAVTDANGNVVQLYSATNAVTARYEYGPFGEMLRATGPAADECPIRYSSEYYDTETELYYYGHRYYSPRQGRWLSKDPIEEQGGLNLYGFVGNNTPNKYDVLGLAWHVERTGGQWAKATVIGCPDTVENLAKKIGLRADEYQKWLRGSAGKLPENREMKLPIGTVLSIPNTVLAYSADNPAPWNRTHGQSSAWNKNIQSFQKNGFAVEVHDYRSDIKTANLGLLPIITGMAQNRSLHGFLFWGHGATEGLGAIKHKPYIWGNSEFTMLLPYSSLSRYSNFYKLSFGAVFACYSNVGRHILHNVESGHGWFGYQGQVGNHDITINDIDISAFGDR